MNCVPRINHLKMTNDPRVIMQLLRESFEAVRRLNPCMAITFDLFAKSLAYIQHGSQVSKLRVIDL